MNEFSERLQFLMPCFDLNQEERQIFERFYRFLDESGVAEIIKKCIRNTSEKGGRPNVNYFNLFAVVLYGFSQGRSTLRELEDACGHDIRYINIMEQVRPSYSTIANFINKVIVPYEEEIFSAVNRQILKDMSIDLEDVFIDGTKWEANANKYKFVWKPITFHRKLSATLFRIMKENELCQDFREEELVRSSTITKVIDTLERDKERYDKAKYEDLQKSITAILVKVLEYEEKERICGDGRKSYYKTDHDATAMCLKSDYYSGLGSNLHAAYNVQATVARGIVVSYYVSQSRTDINDFIPTIEKLYGFYGKYPLNVCADSGYGSLENYRYLEMKGINSYVKPLYWEGNVSGSYPDQFRINEDDTITCLNGNIGFIEDIPGRHHKKAGSVFFKVQGCDCCGFRDYCMRFMKQIEGQSSKIFEVNIEFQRLKQNAEQNLLSVKGIEIRVNRSIQVEGVFGIEKQDIRYMRTRRRGIQNVSTEMMLTFLGLNVKRLLNFFKTGKRLDFWIAPDDLTPELFKKPSAKRLSKKGKKTHNNIYK